jgi:hypothetical protein
VRSHYGRHLAELPTPAQAGYAIWHPALSRDNEKPEVRSHPPASVHHGVEPGAKAGGSVAPVPKPGRRTRKLQAARLRFAVFLAAFFFAGAFFFFTALAIVISPSREVRIISNMKNMRYSNCFVDR